MLTVMRTKALRDIQMAGTKAVRGREPFVIETRNGPFGIFIPVDEASLPLLQEEVERMVARASLRRTWTLARKLGLDKMSDRDIAAEVRAVRSSRRHKRVA